MALQTPGRAPSCGVIGEPLLGPGRALLRRVRRGGHSALSPPQQRHPAEGPFPSSSSSPADGAPLPSQAEPLSPTGAAHPFPACTPRRPPPGTGAGLRPPFYSVPPGNGAPLTSHAMLAGNLFRWGKARAWRHPGGSPRARPATSQPPSWGVAPL